MHAICFFIYIYIRICVNRFICVGYFQETGLVSHSRVYHEICKSPNDEGLYGQSGIKHGDRYRPLGFQIGAGKGLSTTSRWFSGSVSIYPQDEGFARRANPEGWPSNHQPIGKMNLTSIGVSFYTSYRTLSPMEQLAIFLLGFHWRFTENTKSPSPMEQFAVFLLWVHLGLIQVWKTLRPHETTRHIFIRVSLKVYTSHKIHQPHGTIRRISITGSFKVLNKLWNPPAPWNNSPYFCEGFI